MSDDLISASLLICNGCSAKLSQGEVMVCSACAAKLLRLLDEARATGLERLK